VPSSVSNSYCLRLTFLVFALVWPPCRALDDSKSQNTLDWYFGYKSVDLKNFSGLKVGSSMNPSPASLISDLRWSYQLQNEQWSYQLTPRLNVSSSRETKGEAELFMQDAYGQWSNSNHQLRLGIQNFQWGPAELLSPSNPIFAFDSSQRWFFYQQRGRSLAKWHWTIDKSWAFSAVSEVANNGEVPPIENENFRANALVKLETRSSSGQNYIGLIAGVTPEEKTFWGEYFAYYFTDSFSIYNDSRFVRGNSAYFPVITSTGVELQQTRSADSNYYPLAITGFRWETSTDLRLEYVYNEYGMSRSDWQQTLFSIIAPTPYQIANQKRFERNGHSIPGKNLLYLSWRVPDLGPRGIYSLHLRALRSLDDQSGNLQSALERSLGEAFTVYASAAQFYGASDSFFGSSIYYELVAGLKWSH
jgi:hypothetical protein